MHRDIKPENILIQPGDGPLDPITLKLTDFGFASYFKKENGLSQVLGSPLYMAPELIE